MGIMRVAELSIDYDTFVVVRCGYCGALWSFCPRRVAHHRECYCGNGNWGSPPEWFEGKFGDFDLLWWEKWDLRGLFSFGGMSIWEP